MVYKCSHCGKEFDGHKRNVTNRFCSLECYNEYRKQEYTKKFNLVFGDNFEIVAFEEKNIVIKCKTCNAVFYRCLKQIWSKGVKCLTCAKREQEQRNEIKAHIKERQRAIQSLIRTLRKRVTQLNREQEKKDRLITKVCPVCGKEFRTIYDTQKYCSKQCQVRVMRYIQELKKRKGIEASAIIDRDITLRQVYEKDNGVCYLCGKKCDYEDYKIINNAFIVGDNYPSIDHVIPISKGGEHSWGNVRLAHMSCNSQKGEK